MHQVFIKLNDASLPGALHVCDSTGVQQARISHKAQ